MGSVAVRERLDEAWTVARARAIGAVLRHRVDRDDVVAVHEVAVHAVSTRLLGDGLRAHLLIGAHGDGILIVLHEEQRGRLAGSRTRSRIRSTGWGRRSPCRTSSG